MEKGRVECRRAAFPQVHLVLQLADEAHIWGGAARTAKREEKRERRKNAVSAAALRAFPVCASNVYCRCARTFRFTGTSRRVVDLPEDVQAWGRNFDSTPA